MTDDDFKDRVERVIAEYHDRIEKIKEKNELMELAMKTEFFKEEEFNVS